MRVASAPPFARVHAFASSNLATQLYCAPGNAGTEQAAENVALDVMDFDGLIAFARERPTP